MAVAPAHSRSTQTLLTYPTGYFKGERGPGRKRSCSHPGTSQNQKKGIRMETPAISLITLPRRLFPHLLVRANSRSVSAVSMNEKQK